jgi:thiol-disulfide isomerase/thioredoxin
VFPNVLAIISLTLALGCSAPEPKEIPHLTVFTASWCTPCKKNKPRIEKLIADGLVEVEEYDIDENKELASEMGIKNVPTYIFCYNGQCHMTHKIGVVERLVKDAAD